MYILLTIAKNTFTETLRQPIYAIIIASAILLFVISPSLTMYTMSDDNKLLREIGLSTLFLTSLFIAIFSASGAVAQELESKTVTTVLSKPVRRPIFILGKFLGVSSAVAIAHFICTTALLMAIRHGVLESAGDEHDWTVILAATVSVFASLLLAAFFDYYFGWKFSSTAVLLLALFSAFSLIFLGFIDRHWAFHPAENGFNAIDVWGTVLLLLAAIILTAWATLFSSRFNIVVTLSVCVGIFLLGLVSDYVFGRFAETHLWAKIGYYLIPNLQIFWISDAIYEESSKITFRYLAMAASYTACYTGAVLAAAIALFQRRQIG